MRRLLSLLSLLRHTLSPGTRHTHTYTHIHKHVFPLTNICLKQSQPQTPSNRYVTSPRPWLLADHPPSPRWKRKQCPFPFVIQAHSLPPSISLSPRDSPFRCSLALLSWHVLLLYCRCSLVVALTLQVEDHRCFYFLFHRRSSNN